MIKIIRDVLNKYSERIVYKSYDNEITYNDLLNKANYYSDLLIREGNSPIIIINKKEIESFVAMISCILSKRAYVMIDADTPLERVNQIIKDTNSSLIISNNKFLNSIKLSELSKFKNQEIKKNYNEIAYIVYTSGSTGIPKGVPISYKNLYTFINWISNSEYYFKFNHQNILNTASFSFDLSVADIYYSLFNGHTLIANTSNVESLADIYKIIKKEQINIIFMTPTFAKLLLLEKDFNENNYSCIKNIYFCGEKLESTLVERIYNRFSNIEIINAYGPTEATSAVSMIKITKNMLNNDLPVGEINNISCEVIIDNNEIVLKGDSVFSGYLNIKSEKCYKENDKNCYKTGDLGYIMDNLLYCIGRKDNQIKYKGYRIELEEIENNIQNIKNVKECAVVAHKENNIVKYIKAFVVTDIEDVDIIKSDLSNKLPNYMIPKIIKKIDKLPINDNGKVDRKELEKYD